MEWLAKRGAVILLKVLPLGAELPEKGPEMRMWRPERSEEGRVVPDASGHFVITKFDLFCILHSAKATILWLVPLGHFSLGRQCRYHTQLQGWYV